MDANKYTQCLSDLWVNKEAGSRIGVRDDGVFKDLGPGTWSRQKWLLATLSIHHITALR